MPMELFSTSDLNDALISKALKAEEYPTPSALSLEFIKNFARNYRAKKGTDGIMIEYVLN